MNHHDIKLIEIGQKEGYAKAVSEIVAWLRDENVQRLGPWYGIAATEIETKFGGTSDGQFYEI